MATSHVTLTSNRAVADPRAAKRTRSWLQALAALVLAGVILPAVLILGVLIIFEGTRLILPGVSVTGVDLGSLSPDQSTALLDRDWNTNASLTLTDGKQTWQAKPIDYGLYLDPGATTRAAYMTGRDSYEDELKQIFTRARRDVKPVIVFNPAFARARLELIASQIGVDPEEAGLFYENGKWTATPGKTGQALDIDATLAQVAADPQLVMMLGKVQLNIRPVSPQVADLSAQAAANQARVDQPLNIKISEPASNQVYQLTIAPETLKPRLKVEDSQSADPKISLDSAAVQAYLDQWRLQTLGSWRVLQPVQNLDQLTQIWQQGQPLEATVVINPELVNKPLHFRAYDPISDETFTLDIPPETLAAWVKVDDPQSTDPKISLDGSQLQATLDQWRLKTLGSGRVLDKVQGLDNLTDTWQQGKELFAMVHRLPTSWTVRAGDTIYSISARVGIPYWRIQNANPGIAANGLSTGQTLVIPSKNDLLPLPVVLGKRIVISISQQHMWAYENGQLHGEYVISSGMASSPTMPGVFQVTEHIVNAYGARWDLWMPNWLSIYEAAPGFFNGIHGLPLLHNGVRLWANALGHPASYGCIILSLKNAEDIYNWADNGVVVEIKN
jgi:LysM repeat protein